MKDIIDSPKYKWKHPFQDKIDWADYPNLDKPASNYEEYLMKEKRKDKIRDFDKFLKKEMEKIMNKKRRGKK